MDLEKRVFVIPHFHYDVAWIRKEKEYLKMVYKILGKVVKIMEKDHEFRYVVDQAFYLQELKTEKPKLFLQVAEEISEGRIEVVNAGYAMPDLNLISPSAIKKNYEIMNDFAEREFNTKPKVAWMIDCFGHPGMMPKLAKETGLRYYVFWRGMNLPESTQEFVWFGADGSSVLTHWMKHGYSLFGYNFKDLMRAVNVSDPSTNLVFIPFGADFYIPDEKLIQQVHDAESARFALPSEFFKELEKHENELPKIEGEMLSDFCNFWGYYSSRISFKQLYRRAEREILKKDEVREEEWKNLLYAAFHDLICGTGIDEVYPYAEKKLRKIKIERKRERKARSYKGKFLRRISFELKAEEGDLYHTIPSMETELPPNSVKLESFLKNSGLDLIVRIDFQHPRHILRIVVNTGIRDGRLTHHLWKNVWTERKLNTSYALNDFFEYKDDNNGFRFHSDDCFDYEVRDTGKVYLTLVRSVQILSHGDAGPRTMCPKALELGKHLFKISMSTLGKKEWL